MHLILFVFSSTITFNLFDDSQNAQLNAKSDVHSQNYVYLPNHAYDSNELSSLSIEKKQHNIVAFVTNGKEIKCIAIKIEHVLVIACFDLCFRQI